MLIRSSKAANPRSVAEIKRNKSYLKEIIMKKNTKKVVVQVVQHLRAGGIECLVLEMMRTSLMSQNEDMHIISLEGTMEEALSHWPRLKPFKTYLHFINKKPGISIRALLKVRTLLKELNADVLHSHHIGPLLYGGIAARFSDIQCRIHTEHDAWHMQDAKRRKLESGLLKLVSPKLVADASDVEQQLKIYQPNYPSQVIHNGIDCELFNEGSKADALRQLGLEEYIDHKKTIYIGCSGRLTEVKGHKYLIDALELLSDNCVLLLAGEGEYRSQIEKYIEKKRLTKKVILLGTIDNMVQFYQSLDVFCLPSINEGLPLSPLEAQACGIPVILTDVGGCREACCPESGLMVPTKDVSALAGAISKTLKQLAEETLTSPRSFVIAERNFSHMFDQYRTLYQQ